MAVDLAPFLERRRRFADALGDSLAIIPGARDAARNADTDFEFRQDSDFYFLTGFDEPDAVAVFNPSHAKERFVLFVRPRDREQEIWTGRRAGVEGAIDKSVEIAPNRTVVRVGTIRIRKLDRIALADPAGGQAITSPR